MSNWKIGDELVCINKDGWIDGTSMEICGGPLYGERCFYEGLDPLFPDYIYLNGYNGLDAAGRRDSFYYTEFRKLSDYLNELSEIDIARIIKEIEEYEFIEEFI